MAPSITIKWQGPLSSKGRSYPVTKENVEAKGLYGPGVYVLLQHFSEYTSIYVGKSWFLGDRMRAHLANYLGFFYSLRKKEGVPVKDRAEASYDLYWPSRDGFNMFNDLEKNLKLSRQAVESIEFYYCRCDASEGSEHWDVDDSLGRSLKFKETDIKFLLHDIEAHLIHSARNIAAASRQEKRTHIIVSDNYRRETPRNIVVLPQDAFDDTIQEWVSSWKEKELKTRGNI